MASLVFENKVKAWEKSRLEVRKYISDPQFAEQDGYFSEVEQMAFGGYLVVNVTPIRTYRRRVEDYLKEHLSDDDTLQKIYHLEPLSGQDITRLELIFWEELGSKAEFEAQTRTKPYQHNVAAFIRSIIGVEQEVALEKYRALIHGAELTRMQEEYLRMLIRYVCENGDIATVVLQQPPFNKFPVIFRDSRESLIDYVKLISQVIAV